MPISYPGILDLREENQRIGWDDRDVMLYALALGMGAGPTAAHDLDYVYEKRLKVVPAFVAVACFGKRPLRRAGIDYLRMLHLGQQLTCHAPIPTVGRVIVDSRIRDAVDKGAGRGAVITTETVVRDEHTGALIATANNTIIARGDGGFGGPSRGTANGTAEAHRVPQRAPDVSLDFVTQPNQALLYRLCNDRNPMHADPVVAAASGFARPVLHGLCTYGMACRAVLSAYDLDPSCVRTHAARFAAPVFPGDTLTFDLWRDGDDVSFEARVKARNEKVMTHGITQLGF